MNQYNGSGYLGNDAETRFTKSGTAICSFNIGIKTGYGDREGTLWIKCQLWGSRAEGGLVQYLKKGSAFEVTGELSMDVWTTKDGVEKSTLQMNVSDIGFCPGGSKSERTEAAPEPDKYPQDGGGLGTGAMGEDVPF